MGRAEPVQVSHGENAHQADQTQTEHPTARGVVGVHKRQHRSQDGDQREGAQSRQRLIRALALKSDQQPQEEGDAELFKKRIDGHECYSLGSACAGQPRPFLIILHGSAAGSPSGGWFAIAERAWRKRLGAAGRDHDRGMPCGKRWTRASPPHIMEPVGAVAFSQRRFSTGDRR